MASGTLTTARKGVHGDIKYWMGTYDGPASYATGGDPIVPADFGFTTAIHNVTGVAGDATIADQRFLFWDATNSKLMQATAINTQTANATNTSTLRFNLVAWGY